MSDEPGFRDRLLTYDEAAKVLGLRPSHLRKIVSQKRGPARKKLGAAVRFTYEDLMAWVESETRKADAEGVEGEVGGGTDGGPDDAP